VTRSPIGSLTWLIPQTRPTPEKHVLRELLGRDAGIQLAGDGHGRRRFCINGRHRITAMLQAGVGRTVVIHW
jgi:hypothetical protein